MRGFKPPDQSFVSLVDDEYRGMTAASLMIVGCAAVAEEIVQDVFERAYLRWDEVSKLDRPGAWVRRAVVNQSISTTRRVTSERRALDRLVGRTRVVDDGVAEPMEEIWSAVKALPTNQKTAVALHYGADLAIVDIAESLSLSESAVKALLHRARASLREHETIKEMVR